MTGSTPGRTLHLLRHAKSDWSDPTLRDHDRPLAPRGRRARHVIAEHVRGAAVDLVVCSTARRARQTAKPVAKALGCELRLEPSVYPGDVDGLLTLLRGLPGDARSVMLVGHNPAFEDLSEVLTGTWERYPTAALGTIVLDVAEWADVAPGTGRLVSLVTARALEEGEEGAPPPAP